MKQRLGLNVSVNTRLSMYAARRGRCEPVFLALLLAALIAPSSIDLQPLWLETIFTLTSSDDLYLELSSRL